MLIEQTKSRPRHFNDNSLAEAIEEFYEEYSNPYLNFHRPCGVPEVETGAKGKQRRVYRWYATPWEILRQLRQLLDAKDRKG